MIAAVAHTLICGERDVAKRQDFDDEVIHACLLLSVIHGVCHLENKTTNTDSWLCFYLIVSHSDYEQFTPTYQGHMAYCHFLIIS